MNEQRAINTEKLLKAISTRLAGRDDCKDEYIIYITDSAVFANRYIKVYPSRYKRKEADSLSVVQYAGNLLGLPTEGDLTAVYVEGNYQFANYTSKGRTKRRWIKL